MNNLELLWIIPISVALLLFMCSVKRKKRKKRKSKMEEIFENTPMNIGSF
jgi:cytochrome c-type biogenesis protein CcmH/NrfF